MTLFPKHWLRLAHLATLLTLGACAAAHATGPRMIVQFPATDASAAFSPGPRVARLANDAGVEATLVRRMASGAHLVQLPEGADVRAAARAAMERGGARIAVRDRHVKAAKVATDPNFNTQWYLKNDPVSVSAQAAWDITTGSASVVVAVLDTGMLPHPDLAGRFLPGYDFVSDVHTANDGNGRDPDPTDPGDWVSQADLDSGNFKGCDLEDSSWHGTMVSGIIGANANNGLFLAGMDWAASILPVRVLGKCGGDFSDIFDAIAWAGGFAVPGVPSNPFPAQVVNLSLGGTSDEPCLAEEDALLAQLLGDDGIRAIVVSAGNEDGDAALSFPASCPSTISVTATTNTGNKASYANAGPSVDLAAPGGDGNSFASLIPVLWNTGTTVVATDTYAASGGTSFSAPIVSGVASLMLSVAPWLTPTQLRAILVSSYKPFPTSSTCTFTSCGHGIVDARAAVATAKATAPAAHKLAVVEYFNAGFGHYFMSGDAGEIASLDAGAFNGAFQRTGFAFNAWDAPATGTSPVCRFFTTAFAPKSSHFYTADPAECELVKHAPEWTYERIAFHIRVPVSGACPAGTAPVFRMYNNGQTGAPNHRFTTDVALYQQFTTTMNWAPEGVKFCAPG